MKRAPIKSLPSLDELQRLLHYDAVDGLLTWRLVPPDSQASKRRNTLFAGKEAGHLDATSYVRVTVNGIDYMAHRVIWKLITGADPTAQIDHIDGQTTNNRWANLRHVTQDQNQANRKISANNTSGFNGVAFIQAHQKWRAAIGVNGQKKHLGYFATPEEAHLAFADAEERLRGEYARPK